jgi:hypothetical protein
MNFQSIPEIRLKYNAGSHKYFDINFHLSYSGYITYMSTKITPIPNFVYIIIVLLVINILAIDVWIFNVAKNSNNKVLGVTTAESECPQSCINRINQLSTTSKTSSKEYYIPLGSGTSTQTDWSDVTGAQAYIDNSAYGRIKTATFEVTIQVPTGNQKVWVRLFNATDKHPVWYSDVAMEGTGPTLIISSPITLDPGKKLYLVQIKSQLGSITQINQARVHIVSY